MDGSIGQSGDMNPTGTKVCQRCGHSGPWKRKLTVSIFQDVIGIDGDQQLHVETTDYQFQEGRTFRCLSCGASYPAPMWKNGLEDAS
jgi:hypothetical protein